MSYGDQTSFAPDLSTIQPLGLEIVDLAHLGHAELLTPTPDESLDFFVRVLGMQPVHDAGDSVFLRGFGDYERYCLKLTASDRPGLGHVALRARSQASLDRRVAALERTGYALGWSEGDIGHGPSYAFQDPSGQRFEIYYETERYVAPPELAPAMRNQPQRRVGRGVGVRRLEHVNLTAPDVRAVRRFFEGQLGYRSLEVILAADEREWGAWLSVTLQGHELIYLQENVVSTGRLHHLAFWVDTREEVLRAADLFQDDGVFIEAGPAKHTPVHSFYIYVYEPGGNRIEVTSGGQLVFDPDGGPTVWTDAEYRSSRAWGREFPSSFHTYATPLPSQADMQPRANPMPDGAWVRPA